MKGRYISFLITIATLFAGWRIYTLMILPAGPFRWDEAAHALRGLLIAEDLRQGSWLGFLLDTYRQVYWPPLHSWLTGAAFLFSGPEAAAARACSLAAFSLTVPPLCLAAQSMRKTAREAACLSVAVLFLTSPILISFASQCMLETSGILAVSLTILAYFGISRDEASSRKHIFLGLAITITYFVKSNYGILLALTTALALLCDSRFRLRALLTRANFYIILPMLVIFPVWFAYPKKLWVTWQAMVNMPSGVREPFSVAGLLYYPRAVDDLAGSAWIFALWLLSLAVAFVYRKDAKVRFLLLLVIVQMAFGTFHHTKITRHILPLLPPLILLTGFGLAEAWSRLLQNRRRAAVFLAIPVWGALLFHAAGLGHRSMRPHTAGPGGEAGAYIAALVRDNGPAFVLGTRGLHAPTPPLLDWQLIVGEQLMTIHQAGSLAQYEENHGLIKRLKDLNAPSWLVGALQPLLTRFDHPSIGRTLYMGLPPDSSYSYTREGLELFLREVLARTPCRTLILVTPLSDQPRVSEASLNLALQASGLRRVSTKFFTSARTRVDVYETASWNSP